MGIDDSGSEPGLIIVVIVDVGDAPHKHCNDEEGRSGGEPLTD